MTNQSALIRPKPRNRRCQRRTLFCLNGFKISVEVPYALLHLGITATTHLPENLPQTGISLFPCAARFAWPLRTLVTCMAGYFPEFFWARAVKSAGATLSADAAGPSPLPSLP